MGVLLRRGSVGPLGDWGGPTAGERDTTGEAGDGGRRGAELERLGRDGCRGEGGGGGGGSVSGGRGGMWDAGVVQ
jgi:hypothetical protein